MYETALKLINEIEKFGYKAYMVGGFPRDLYLNRKSSDVDICTDARPAELMNIFKDIEKTNIEYGSIRIIYDKVIFDITTFRRDLKYNGRKPEKIIYIDNLEADLHRRDFTVNTLCISKDGERIDMLNAIEDMDKKIIKTVDLPKISIKEDALRILRAIRFATILDFDISLELQNAIRKGSSQLKKLSKNRIKEELDIIFSHPNKLKGIEYIRKLKIADHLELPKLKTIKITPSAITTWALLDPKDKTAFTSNEREMISNINVLIKKDILNERVLYDYGLYLCQMAGEINNIDKKEIQKKYSKMAIHSKLDIALSPTEICETLNRKPGSFLKEIITDLENKVLNCELNNTQNDIKKYIENTFN